MVLSEGRSIFKNAIHVPVKQVSSAEDHAKNVLKVKEVLQDKETMEQMRFFYLAMVTFAETTLDAYELSPESTAHA